MESKKFIEEVTYEIIGSAIEVYKIMGRVLFENFYQMCMEEEMELRGLTFDTELKIPVIYKSKSLNIDFRCDFFIEQCIVLELKAVKEIVSLYEAQVLTYMHLLQAPKGILLNFASQNIFKDGQKTFVNEYFRSLPDE